MSLFKSKKTIVLLVTAIVALTTSAIVAFGMEEDPTIVKGRENAALILEEKTELDKTLKSQAPDKYPKGLEKEDKGVSGPETINILDGTKSNTEELNKKINALSDDKKREYTKWVDKGRKDIGSYKRKTQEIISGVSETKRITLKEVNEIIAKEHEFNNQVTEIEKIHGTPDFIGGSGVMRKEYWLDDEGKDKIIVLIEQGDIFHGTKKINNH